MRILFLLALLMPTLAQAAGLTVFAAASLTDAFNDVGTLWRAQGHQVTFQFASSATLAQQIEHGAQADVFASADEMWMDRLATDNRIRPDTRADLVGNTLVLVEPARTLHPITLKRGTDLAAVLGAGGRLAVGDPDSVPAGIYARQALRALGMWENLQTRLAPAENVRSALLLVARGEAPAGIVYGTDVRADPHVGIAGTFPEDSHDPIRYPVAMTKTRRVTEAKAFMSFLHTQPAQDVFLHYGFKPL